MKRIAYSFLLIFALSCGTGSSSSSDHVIKVTFRNLSIQDYVLLSVRSDGLVVNSILANSDPELISFQKIKRVYNPGIKTLPSSLLGGFLGCTAGFVASTVSLRGYDALAAVIVLMPLGILSGTVIGCNAADAVGEYNLSKPDERTRLAKLSMYPDTEPPELQKIK